jgi:hypothetical protein
MFVAILAAMTDALDQVAVFELPNQLLDVRAIDRFAVE